ncbi:MAG: chemotaxis protein CheW [Solirubrobacterales bacterium]
MAVQTNKFLTFMLGEEYYGIPILKVKEIIGMMTITGVPRMPDFMKGVINLRGKIIPVMDLRIKFGMAEKDYHDRTCIIVTEMESKNGRNLTGVVVDSVSEVLDIGPESIEPPPNYTDWEVDQEFLTGMGKVKEKVVMLLDADKILTAVELNSLTTPRESVPVEAAV